MARIERINKARKEQKCSKCGCVIEVGMPYLKATPYRQRPITRCTKCGLKSYETSGSEYVKECGAIVEDWRENYDLNESTADEIASALEELRDQQQDSLDNMPENLQQGDTGQMLQERIDSLECTIDELNKTFHGKTVRVKQRAKLSLKWVSITQTQKTNSGSPKRNTKKSLTARSKNLQKRSMETLLMKHSPILYIRRNTA